MSVTVDSLYDLRRDHQEVVDLEANLAKARAKAEASEQEAQAMIHTIADIYLTDREGRPVDGGVYWYSRQAIVRVNGEVHLLPLLAINSSAIDAALNPVIEESDEALPEAV